MSAPDERIERCTWAGHDPLNIAYHDNEWGVPVRDDRALFELLTLEGAQAGLSWITVLKKRTRYREAFDGFDWRRVARYREPDIARRMQDAGLIRNRRKIEATVNNARALIRMREETGSFATYLWQLVGGRPVTNHWGSSGDVPATTPLAHDLSRDLKKRGFQFVGPTICYAFMQAAGLVNDHTTDCFRHRECAALA